MPNLAVKVAGIDQVVPEKLQQSFSGGYLPHVERNALALVPY